MRLFDTGRVVWKNLIERISGVFIAPQAYAAQRVYAKTVLQA